MDEVEFPKEFMDKLPTELWEKIVDFLQCTSPPSVSQVGRVKNFHQMCQYRQSSSITLDLEAGWSKRAQMVALQSQDLLSAVRHVRILESAFPSLLAIYKDGDQVADFLSRLPGLREVEISGRTIAPQILEVLKTLPRVSLTTRANYFDYGSTYGPDSSYFPRLQYNENLRSLHVKAVWRDVGYKDFFMSSLKGLLLSCPNLKILSLVIDRPHMLSLTASGYVGMNFKHGEKIPALEKLRLEGYMFTRGNTIGDKGQYPFLAGRYNTKDYHADPSEMDYWVDCFDWSKLKCLETTHMDFAWRAAPHFTALEEVALNAPLFENVSPILLRLPQSSSLVTIAAPSFKDGMLSAISRHAATLENLSIHSPELEGSMWQRHAISATSLEEIGRECKVLRNLALDVHRKRDMPWDILHILSKFPSLRELHLYMELGRNNKARPTRPSITFESVAQMFEQLARDTSGRLKKFTVDAGTDYLDAETPTFEDSWVKLNCASFECAVAESDDRAAAGDYTLFSRKVQAYECRVEPEITNCPSLGFAGRLWRRLTTWKAKKKAKSIYFIVKDDEVEKITPQHPLFDAVDIAHEGPQPWKPTAGEYWEWVFLRYFCRSWS